MILRKGSLAVPSSDAPEDRIRRSFSLKRRIVRTTAWIIRADGLILLVRSRARDSSKWGLPGGFSKAIEPPIQTVRREVFEETGLNIQLQQRHEIAHYIQPWAWHLDVLYRFDLDEETSRLAATGALEANLPRSLEISERRWIDLDNPNEMVNVELTDEAFLALSVLKRNGNHGIKSLWFLYYYDGNNPHHEEDHLSG
jgi:ADP-ribose pyrophosphatase YjhB (NUDIX family)